MKLVNTPAKYGFVSLALHWIIVVAIVAQWILAEAGEEAEKAARTATDALTLHQSIGLLVLLLAAFRLLWRLANPAPAWPADMKPYEIRIARAVHVAFYVLLFALPLTGWALSSVEDEPLRFFTFDIPRIVLGGEETLEEIHEALFNVLAGLALLHVLGAAKHWLAGRKVQAAGM